MKIGSFKFIKELQLLIPCKFSCILDASLLGDFPPLYNIYSKVFYLLLNERFYSSDIFGTREIPF